MALHKQFSECSARVMELAFGTADADVEQGTYFFVCVSCDVMKSEHMSIPIGQSCDCLLNVQLTSHRVNNQRSFVDQTIRFVLIVTLAQLFPYTVD